MFCNFGQLYKVDSRTLDLWVKIINSVPRSVLWLLSFPSVAVPNLKRVNAQRGVATSRIVFSKLYALDRHIHVKTLCDVGLDTLTFNGVSALCRCLQKKKTETATGWLVCRPRHIC